MVKQLSVRLYLKPEALRKEAPAKDVALQKQPFPDVYKKVLLKVAATYVRYFTRSKFCKSYVHKKNFSLI